jgi:hypothetical protein
MRPPELPLEGEDQTSFWNSTCRWFCNLMGSNGTEWVAQACPFVANDTWVHVAFDDPDQSVDPYWANASFFWNMTSGGAHHTLWNATAHYNNYPIPPFTWGWDTWPAADPRGYPFLTKDSGSGELGTTAHWPWFGGCR